MIKRTIIERMILAFMVFNSWSAISGSNPWADISKPTQGSAESIGTYTAGCVKGASKLPENGEGYQVMRLSRNRVFGHPVLINFIEQLGRQTAADNLGSLLVGDLGQPRGGPTLSGHRSHQTGLDVDIWFLLSPTAAQRLLSYNEREDWGAPSVVDTATDAINFKQWTPKQALILAIAAQMPEVERIFVNASIKRELCKKFKSSSWIGKIRPWYKHDDHFHVRLKCPAGSLDCRSQEPVPSGDGCDASLDWWFSAEAKVPAKPGKPAPPPPLPERCTAVLTQ